MQPALAVQVADRGPDNSVAGAVCRHNRNWPTTGLSTCRIRVSAFCHQGKLAAADAVLAQWPKRRANVDVAVPVSRRRIDAHWAVGVEPARAASCRIDQD